jgi:hypothetical protein
MIWFRLLLGLARRVVRRQAAFEYLFWALVFRLGFALALAAKRRLSSVLRGLQQENFQFFEAAAVLTVRRDFRVYTFIGLQDDKVIRIGKVWIMLRLAERDYLVVFTFAFFRAHIFLNDLD